MPGRQRAPTRITSLMTLCCKAAIPARTLDLARSGAGKPAEPRGSCGIRQRAVYRVRRPAESILSSGDTYAAQQLANNERATGTFEQGSRGHPGLLDHQDRRHDPGRDGGDAVTMSLGLGYVVGSAIFAAIFVLAVIAQVSARRFHPWLYWTTIVATTTLGTTLADFADRSLGIGYAGGASLLLALLMASYSSGIAPWVPCRWPPSERRKRRCSIGPPSCSRRPWARRWATGRQIRPVLALPEVRFCLAASCCSSLAPTTGLPYRARHCSGRLLF